MYGRTRMRERGFTLLELVLILAILGLLSLTSLGLYTTYTLRAGLAQTLVHVGHIRTSVAVESASGRERELEAGAQPGKAPPKLSILADHHFNAPDGVRLWLVRAPPGTFATEPDRSSYALAASSPGEDGLARLRAFYRLVQSDKIWLSESSFMFPLVPVEPAGPASGPPAPPPPNDDPAPQPPPPDQSPPETGPCPPGWAQVGKNNCKPPTPQDCPQGYKPVGKSGMCRAQ